MKYLVTADEHYGHENVINYSVRPYKNADEMNQSLIDNANSITNDNDITFHVGDVSINKSNEYIIDILNQIKGKHILIKGSHDRWEPEKYDSNKKINFVGHIFEKKVGKNYFVFCHYPMRSWPRSHYNSILLYGHSHGNMIDFGNSMDVGVDCNLYKPFLLTDIVKKFKVIVDK